jgi:NADPH2:quinone reductase
MVETAYWFFERFGEPKAVLQRGRQTLSAAGKGQAAVAIRAVGLNQSDYRYVLGTHLPPDHCPSCVAHEAVGEIIELGPEVDGPSETRKWRTGDRVALAPMLVDRASMGALRQIGVYEQSALLPVPDNYSDAQGGAYWNAILTIAGAMDMARLGPETSKGKTVAFTAAAGGIATVGLQLARAWGALVLATTRRQDKVTLLSHLADHVTVVRRAQDLVPALRGTPFERGIDVIIDPIGGEMVACGLEALAPGGQFVSYEAVAGHAASYDIMDLMAKDLSLHGYTFFRPLRHPGLLDRLVDIGMEYADRMTPVLAANFSFDEAPEAIEALARSEHVGKITIAV